MISTTAQSKGKWYLIEVFNDEAGNPIGARTDFHSAYCGKPGKHHAEQASLDAEYAEERREREAQSERADEERIKAEAEKLYDFLNMSQDERDSLMVGLQRKLDREIENNPTMDHFTDWTRWQVRCEALRNEIAMYEDFMADLKEGV